MATGVSKGVLDEEVAIRLALLSLSEKVDRDERPLVAQALTQPTSAVVDRQHVLRGPRETFTGKRAAPQRLSTLIEVVALLQENYSVAY